MYLIKFLCFIFLLLKEWQVGEEEVEAKEQSAVVDKIGILYTIHV